MGSLDQIEPIETASRDELMALQLDRLRRTVRLAYERVAHYRKKLEAADALGRLADDAGSS